MDRCRKDLININSPKSKKGTVLIKKFCPKCMGTDKNCTLCHPLKVLSNNPDQRQKLREKYLAELWLKARKFQMKDLSALIKDEDRVKGKETNIVKLTIQIKDRFGSWINDDGSRPDIPKEIRELLKV